MRGIKDLASIVSGWSSRRGMQDGVVDKEAGNPGRLQVVGGSSGEQDARSGDAKLERATTGQVPEYKNWKMEEERLQVRCCAVLLNREGKRSYRHAHPDNWSLEVDELFLAGSRVPGGQ